jgi:CRISPR-associated protein Cas2
MTVLILERVPASLRGELSRWMIEPHTGVFIGSLSAMVREKLWQKACQNCKDGAAILISSANTEQGYKIDFWGGANRHITEWEGLQLVTKPKKP